MLLWLPDKGYNVQNLLSMSNLYYGKVADNF